MKPRVPKTNKNQPTPERLRATRSNKADEQIVVVSPETEPAWSLMWDTARYALLGYERHGLGWRWSGRYDLKLLAAALMTNDPIPQDIRRLLATLLDPHKKWMGPKAKIDQRPKKSLHTAMESLAKKRNIRDEYLAGLKLKQKAQYLEALLASKYGVQRTFIREAIKLSDKDLVERSCRILGAKLIGDVDPQT